MGSTVAKRFAVRRGDWVRAFRAGRWFIDSGMRRGTPKEDHQHVITVYGGTGPWKERLGYRAPNEASLVLLDAGGKIRWRHQGLFDAARYAELKRQAEAFLR